VATGTAENAWNSIVRRSFATPPPPSPTPTPTPVPTPTPTPVPTPTPTPVPTPTPTPTPPDGIRATDGLYFDGVAADGFGEYGVFRLYVDAGIDLPASGWTLVADDGTTLDPEVYLHNFTPPEQGYQADTGMVRMIFIARPNCTTMKFEDHGKWRAVYAGGDVGNIVWAGGQISGGMSCGGGGIATIYSTGQVVEPLHNNGTYDVLAYKVHADWIADTPISAFYFERMEDGAILRPSRLYVDPLGDMSYVPAGVHPAVYVEATTGCTPFVIDGNWRVVINGVPQSDWAPHGGVINSGTGPCP
jgi:hypothetical protein